jgi:hypothetical protein
MCHSGSWESNVSQMGWDKSHQANTPAKKGSSI